MPSNSLHKTALLLAVYWAMIVAEGCGDCGEPAHRDFYSMNMQPFAVTLSGATVSFSDSSSEDTVRLDRKQYQAFGFDFLICQKPIRNTFPGDMCEGYLPAW